MEQKNDRPGESIQGLALTSELLENYPLLREHVQSTDTNNTTERQRDPGTIAAALAQSREDTADVIEAIEKALEETRAAAAAGGYSYKVEAFEARYVKGQTYEQVADAMNSGRNSPRRWCDEIMRQMAIRLFGVNGIPHRKPANRT